MSSPSLFKPNTIPLGNSSNQCSKCPRYNREKKGICQYYTDVKPCKVLFVYYEPTEQAFAHSKWDIIFKQPCASTAMAHLGLDAVGFTGARQCPNKRGAPTTNRDSGDKHSFCRGWLDKEIRRYNPSVIVPIGFKATGAVLHVAFPYVINDDASGGTYMGHKIPSGKYNAWICPVISSVSHEDYELTFKSRKDGTERFNQNKQTAEMFADQHVKEALERVDRRPFPADNFDPTPSWSDFDPTRPDKENPEILLINDPEKLTTYLKQHCQKHKYAAFDYECNALSPKCAAPKVLTASVAFGDEKHVTSACVFGFSDKRFFEPWRRFLTSRINKVGANIKYEETWSLSYFNTPVNNWHWDVGVSGHIQDITPGTAGLKYMSMAFFGVGGYDNDVGVYIKGENDNMYSMNTLERCPKRTLFLYNAIDSIMTLKIMYKQKRELKIKNEWSRENLWRE